LFLVFSLTHGATEEGGQHARCASAISKETCYEGDESYSPSSHMIRD
jgi:hypothetical protein